MTRSRLTSPVLASAIFALAFSPAPCGADAGDLDPAFGVGGVVLSDYAAGRDWASDVVVLPDGKLLVVGTVAIGVDDSAMAVARHHPDGTLDLSFGVGGWATIDFSAAGDVAYRALVLDDGRILLGGLAYRHWALARLMPDGSLDSSFGTGGRATLVHLGGVDWIRGLAVLPDGKIIAGGMVDTRTSARYDFAVARLHPDGTLDTSFGVGGRVTTDFFGSSDYGESLLLQPDGAIVLAGRVGRSAPVDASMGLVRYTADGALDASFGTGGTVTVDFGDNLDLAYDVVLQDDGKLVVVGQTGIPTTAPPVIWLESDLAVIRLDASGSPDPSFGDGGRVAIDLGDWFGYGFRAALQANGKITVAGYRATDRTSLDGDLVVARLSSDGSADAEFGDAGVAITDLGGRDHGYAVALQADGRIVVAGRQSPTGADADFDFAVVRYLASPEEGIDGLIDIVEDLVDDGAIQPTWLGQIWLALLRTVEWALSIGFDQLAIGLLEAFVNQVQASIGFGSVSAEDGAQLIDSAQALIASISG